MLTRVNRRRPTSSERSPTVTLVLAVTLLLAFALLTAQVLDGGTASFDRSVLSWFRSGGKLGDPIGPAWVEEMARDITSLGSIVVLGFVLTAVAIYLVLIRRREAAILLVAGVLGGWVVSMALKVSINRARPDLPHATRIFTASFPSQHATLSIITVLIIGALLTRSEADRRVRIFFGALGVFLTVIIGLSRIYLGLHYASDVLGGWLVGTSWAILCWEAARHLQRTGRIATNALSFGADTPREETTPSSHG